MFGTIRFAVCVAILALVCPTIAFGADHPYKPANPGSECAVNVQSPSEAGGMLILPTVADVFEIPSVDTGEIAPLIEPGEVLSYDVRTEVVRLLCYADAACNVVSMDPSTFCCYVERDAVSGRHSNDAPMVSLDVPIKRGGALSI